jgi:hypothetical protein
MCHYITATLPLNADVAAVSLVFEKFKLGFEIIHNPHIKSCLPVGELYVLTTRSYCDCGTVLGSSARSATAGTEASERNLARFMKQGWSEAKIQRWLDEKQKAQEKEELKAHQQAEGGKPEASRWVDFLTSVLKSGGANRIGLLLHWYQSGVDNERVKLQSITTLPITEATPELLMAMQEDVLYNFVIKH